MNVGSAFIFTYWTRRTSARHAHHFLYGNSDDALPRNYQICEMDSRLKLRIVTLDPTHSSHSFVETQRVCYRAELDRTSLQLFCAWFMVELSKMTCLSQSLFSSCALYSFILTYIPRIIAGHATSKSTQHSVSRSIEQWTIWWHCGKNDQWIVVTELTEF